MMGDLLHAAGVARALFELVEERIMPLAQHEGVQPAYPATSYGILWQVYSRALWQARSRPTQNKTEAKAHLIGQQILDDPSAGNDAVSVFSRMGLRAWK